MNESIKRIAIVISISGGEEPSVLVMNRFKTAAVMYEGKRKEFFKTVTQQVAVSSEMFPSLVQQVKNGD